ncbi:MAG: GldG family protein [Thermodesulfobacteriota bacterium]|nr:GldG family protein [Thermodesulfobacteriota bacterium]
MAKPKRKIYRKDIGRLTKYGINTGVLIIAFTGILIITNYIANLHYSRWDLTETKAHSLSEKTLKILKSLPGEINITAFFQEGGDRKKSFEKLFDSYKYYSKLLKLKFVDPDRSPALTKTYGITEYGTIVLEREDNEARCKKSTEEDFTNALIKVSRKDRKNIYFLTGHGEHAISNKEKEGYFHFKDSLEKEGFLVSSLLLLKEGKIPEDCNVLVLGGPTKPLFEKEKELLTSYINNDGKILILLDPLSSSGMDEFLKGWGLNIGRNIIIDTLSRLFGGDYSIPIVSNYPECEITRGFDMNTFFPVACSVEPEDVPPSHIEVKTFLKSGDHSWAETSLDNKEAEYNPDDDIKGPVSIGVIVTGKSEKDEKEKSNLKMVVVGDSDFVINNYFNFSGNGDLGLNIINWLGEEEDLISIRPRSRRSGLVHLTRRQGNFIFYFSVFIIPIIIFAAGSFIWWRRRRL